MEHDETQKNPENWFIDFQKKNASIYLMMYEFLLFIYECTWAIPEPISPLPMTVTVFIAFWLDVVLKKVEITGKFFLSEGCLRIWAHGSFEAVHWKREAITWEGMQLVEVYLHDHGSKTDYSTRDWD